MGKYIKLFFILFLKVVYSQIGINTTNPSSNTVLHIDASGNNKNLQPTSETVKDDVVFTKDGQIGVGTINPRVKLDVRSGDNSRNNTIGIGGTNQSASEVGAGAIRYLPINGGVMQYSDGKEWIQMKTPDIEKEMVSVLARGLETYEYDSERTSYTEAISQFTNVKSLKTIYDNKNTFDDHTGIFTAPNNGDYLISFNYDLRYFVLGHPYNNEDGIVEIQFVKDDGINKYVLSKCLRSYINYNDLNLEEYPQPFVGLVGGLCTNVVSLNAKEKLFIQIRQTIYKEGLLLKSSTGQWAKNVNLRILEQ